MRRKKEWRWYAGYAVLALAVLTKGLVAMVFVVFPAIGYRLLTGERMQTLSTTGTAATESFCLCRRASATG